MRLLGADYCAYAVPRTLPVHYTRGSARDEWRKVLILSDVWYCAVRRDCVDVVVGVACGCGCR
jgi:hypothetical protein